MIDVDEAITQALMLQGRLPKLLRDLIDRARAAPPTAANYNWLVKGLMELEGMANEADEGERNVSDTETYSLTTEEVKCPWCGFENQLSDLYSDLRGPESAEVECYECEKKFTAHFSVHISVRAERQP